MYREKKIDKYKLKNLNVIVILQARCGSSRFPYKALYPIKNIPLAIYCAKRLNLNKKYKFILATTKNKKDDYLVSLAKKHKINYERGSEKNVLKRFIDISKNFNENDIIVRATADNPLPDENFLEICLDIYKKNKLNYFIPDHKTFGLPYGLNLEILNVKTLRDQPMTKLNKEHVTFSLRKKKFFDKRKIRFIKRDLSNLNYSIDLVHDYIYIKKKLEKFNLTDNWKKIIGSEKKN